MGAAVWAGYAQTSPSPDTSSSSSRKIFKVFLGDLDI